MKNSLRRQAAILVAETEPVARSSLSDLLRDEGYQVVEAQDSTTGIEHLKNKGLRVILTDLGMPGWYSLIGHARTALPNAFILCMVAPQFIEDVAAARGLGACSFFLKPLEFDQLNESIQKLLAEE